VSRLGVVRGSFERGAIRLLGLIELTPLQCNISKAPVRCGVAGIEFLRFPELF